LGEKCHSDNRLKFDLGSIGNQNITYYNRTICHYDKLSFGILAAYGILQNILVKNNVLVGYKFDDKASAFLRLENEGYRQTANPREWNAYFDSVKLDFIWKHDARIKLGGEAIFRTRGNLLKEVLFVAQHYE